MSEFVDQEKTCRDCPNTFVFTAGEQKFFVEKGFTPPNRCKPCRDRRKAERQTQGNQPQGSPPPVRHTQASNPGPVVINTSRRSSYEQPPQEVPQDDQGRRRRKDRSTRHYRDHDYDDDREW